MIPHRVYVKNFFCYVEQEFRFEAHPVWLLHGPNGAGKSAVFDAMLYALYGESRRSDARKNAVADVIRHGEASMRVEFDFEVSGESYRVWRTRTRGGDTMQGVHRGTNGRWAPIRDINKGVEVSRWVEKTLGLSYDAFVSAVLLRQGSAGRLIDADKDARRELFRGFIDLEPYIRLHERVTATRTNLGAEVRRLRAQVNGMTVVTDEQLADAAAAEQVAEQALKAARTAENDARDRLGHARTWEQNEDTRRRIQGELDAAAALARHAADIEEQVVRLRELRILVPALTRAGELQHALASAEDHLRKCSREQVTSIAQHEELSSALGQARVRIQESREQVAELDRQILAAEADERRLSEAIARAEHAADLHRKLAELKGRSFDPDLDQWIGDAERSAAEAQLAKDALPYLDALARHRADYRRAEADERTAGEAGDLAAGEVERLRREEEAALAEFQGATSSRREAEKAEAVAQDQHRNAIEARDRFADAVGQPVCSICRQPIDLRHAAGEREKLERRIREAEAERDRGRDDLVTRTAEADAAQDRHRELESVRRAAEGHRDDAIRARDDALRRLSESRAAFARAVDALGDPFSHRVAAVGDDGFPTSDDLVETRTTANDLTARIRYRDDLLDRRRDREQARREIQFLEQSIAVIGAPADVTLVRTEQAEIAVELTEIRSRKLGAKDLGDEAARSESRLQSQQQASALRLTSLAVEVARAEDELKSTRQRLAEAIAAIPESFWAAASTATEDDLHALASELALLEDGRVEEQWDALAKDRTLQADRERQLAEVEQHIAGLPEEARRPVAEVQRQVAAAALAVGEADAEHDKSRSLVRALTDRRDRRRETEGRLDEAERGHSLHERLADLLGPEGIQLDLVRRAEGRIIARANEILMRLSSGELRFEPPDPESPRALDLSVRRIGCPAPIGSANLSGGQRFRAAISLALAVGFFAQGERRPLESLVIDEGFGDLDREGRMVMIAELRDGQMLSHMFKRVLVVSHQEDFAAAFPVGYRLRSEGGTTKVEPFGPDCIER